MSINIVARATSGNSRKGSLINMTPSRIASVLGFEPNCEDDDDKVLFSWGFSANHRECGIWDYKASHERGVFSFDGPAEIMTELFGAENVTR